MFYCSWFPSVALIPPQTFLSSSSLHFFSFLGLLPLLDLPQLLLIRTGDGLFPLVIHHVLNTDQ